MTTPFAIVFLCYSTVRAVKAYSQPSSPSPTPQKATPKPEYSADETDSSSEESQPEVKSPRFDRSLLTPRELRYNQAVFNALDEDGDGHITRQEIKDFSQDHDIG